MPTKKLTDLFVERAKAPARGRVEYFDAAHAIAASRAFVSACESALWLPMNSPTPSLAVSPQSENQNDQLRQNFADGIAVMTPGPSSSSHIAKN
jgi:hypothetical protein